MAPTNEEVAYPGKESTRETAEETLRGIAERNAGSDLGLLTSLLLSGLQGDDVQASDPMPAAATPAIGSRQTDASGQEYEWQEDGWHRVEQATIVDETVATTGPVTRSQSVAPTVGAVGPAAGPADGGAVTAAPADGPTVPSENPAVDPGTTPPVSGTPGAPNTTVSEGSSEGPEV